MIYFDNSATSPIDEEVLEAMLPYLKEEFGNPSSKYYCQAENASKAVEEARMWVARLLDAAYENIVFTAGATESTNFIIKGYLDHRKYYIDGKNHVVTSLAEHKATLNTCKYLSGELYSNNDPTISLFGDRKHVDRGFEASFVKVTETGEILSESIESEIKENTALISVIYVNNELGTISDIKKISGMCHSHGVDLHVDLTQAVGKMKISIKNLGIDYASCSAHKIYGPKGIGAAYLKNDAYGIAPITAFMHGGEQEFGFRAGTLPVHNIVGFGKAAEIAIRDFDKNVKNIKECDEHFVSAIKKMDAFSLTNPTANRMPGIISLLVNRKDFNNERFIKDISDKVAMSTGSACSAGEPSYVMEAIGQKENVSKVLRISLNKYTTISEIDKLLGLFAKV